MRRSRAHDRHRVAVRLERLDRERRHELDGARLDEGAQLGAEPAAGGQLVGRTAAVDAVGAAAADGPHDRRAGRLRGEPAECEQGAGGGVPRADDERAPAGEAVAVAAEDVGQGSVDEGRGLLLAEGRQPAGAERVAVLPGAGGVEDRPGPQLGRPPVGVADAQQERPAVAAHGARLVHALARDGRDPGAEPDGVAEHCGERLEVVLGQLVAGGRHRCRGARPAGRCEQALGGRVGDPRPRGEGAHVAPRTDGRADAVAGLQDDERQTSVGQVGGRGQPDGPGPDDDHGQCGSGHGRHPPSER